MRGIFETGDQVIIVEFSRCEDEGGDQVLKDCRVVESRLGYLESIKIGRSASQSIAEAIRRGEIDVK